MASAPAKPGFFQQLGSFPANFWFSNLMEIFERLAFFGVRAIAPLFLVASASQNGLGLSYREKGDIYMWWALLQCLIPMVSGGYTERYGYRKSLAVAFVLNIIGYLGMSQSKAISDYLVAGGWSHAPFWVFLVSACFVATGTAIFKPAVHGTVARTTTEGNSSMGWGLFYWVVNIGGALAPMAAAELRHEIDWQRVFYAAAIVTACNFLPAFLLYREPERRATSPEDRQRGPLGVFLHSILTIFKDLRLVVFLLIFSAFWLMFMQLWDLLPNFIDEWVNTADVAPAFAALRSNWVLENGQVKPEMIININSASIILLVLFVSWFVGKVNKVAAMILGMVISLVGFVGSGLTQIGLLCVVMLLVFSIGEMTCSPTFSAYIALIAPPDKKALYMGYSNIPFAIGWAAGNALGGRLYDLFSSKVMLARRYLGEHLGLDAETLGGLKDAEVLPRLTQALSGGGADDPLKVTQVLWNTYHPEVVWYYLGAIGLAGTLGMVVFYLVTRKSAATPHHPQPA